MIEKDMAEKGMEILKNLLSTIYWKIEELGLPVKNETVLHQQQVFVEVNKIIENVPYRPRQPLDMPRA